jgi:hypothetical protein
MKIRTAKRKGDEFEKFVCAEINSNIDITARRTNSSGAGLDKGDIYCPGVGMIVECKNQKQISLKDWIAQTVRQGNDENVPALIFKNPASSNVNPEPWIALNLYDFFKLYKANSVIVSRETNDNKEVVYRLKALKLAINQLLKSLNE